MAPNKKSEKKTVKIGDTKVKPATKQNSSVLKAKPVAKAIVNASPRVTTKIMKKIEVSPKVLTAEGWKRRRAKALKTSKK